MASSCWIELSGSWHFIKAFKQPLNMISFEKTQEKLENSSIFFYFFDDQVSFFQKWSSEMSSGFLRCNQCIKTLLLSYWTSLSGDFHFHLCKGVPLLGQYLKKSAHMPKIGRNSKKLTFLETVEQKECNDKW